jgi:hypothetical protein
MTWGMRRGFHLPPEPDANKSKYNEAAILDAAGFRRTAETSMTLIWLGALLVLAGVVSMTVQPLWGRLSGGRRLRSGKPIDTLEPQTPARGFGIKSNWPGLALFAIGAVLLLIGAAF